MPQLCAETLIKKLNLEPHIEGGFFRRTFTSSSSDDQHAFCSSIYYLLCISSPLGHLHKNQSDIIHYHHSGTALKYTTISPKGELSETILGSDITRGEQPQLLVQGGYWKATELVKQEHISADYCLISEAVIPGFRYQDMELATAANIRQQFPSLVNHLLPLIKSEI